MDDRAARAVNALLTRLCVTFTVVMTRHTPDPSDPDEPLLGWFNAAAHEHKHDIAEMIEGLGDAYWNLPTSRRWAARRLVRMWEKDGAAAFRDLSASLVNKPPSTPGYPARLKVSAPIRPYKAW